jgi:uncharacterized protein (DUF58 family)
MLTVAAGLVSRSAAIVAWGGALLLGLAVARAVTRLGVTRIRTAGFEMLWREEQRLRRLARGETVELTAELRNRDARAARFVELRAIASPALRVRIEPDSGEVPATGRLRVTVSVTADRVGRHAVHGLSLEVRGGPGLFEVPLTFANSFGFEVLPHAVGSQLRSARGGRSRMAAHAGRPGPLAGDGNELRELREHLPGDPFKQIAWKASARRGILLVREFEREERDVVWLVLDASVEHWAGPMGHAPLDLAVDEVAATASRHLAQGDRVGLAVIASRVLALLPPERGPAQAIEIGEVLARATGTLDADRSDLGELEVASRVLEHLRPRDPSVAAELSITDLDRLAAEAERWIVKAPLPSALPEAPSPRDRLLRRYLEAFGLGSPPHADAERARTERTLAQTLEQLRRERPRPSVIYVWAPAPESPAPPELAQALAQHPRRRMDLRWVPLRAVPSITEAAPLTRAVAYAVGERVRLAEARGEQALRRLGVPVVPDRERRAGTRSRGPHLGDG